jgi:hypothetical protein
MSILFVALSVLCLREAPSSAQPPSAEEVMQHVRQETGIARKNIPAPGLQLTGHGVFAGLPARFRLLFNQQGHFVHSLNARVSNTMGFDGQDVWIQDIGGETHVQELADRRRILFSGLLATSLWIDPASGMKYRLNSEANNQGMVALAFTHEPTKTEGILRIDGKTWMPMDCTFGAEGRKVTYKWSGQIEHAGMKFPRNVESLSGHDVIEAITIESLAPAPTFIKNPYQALLAPPADATFDSTLPAALEVKKATSGHLLVRAKVNGKDVGWFILDSGAGSNILTTRVVKELALEEFGALPALGVGGSVKSSFSRPASLTLGPLTIQNPLVVGFDLSFLDGPLGAPIAGIIGYGTFYRSVVEMDLETPQVALFDPKQYPQNRVHDRWQKLYQTSRVSCVDAEFEGHRGIFRLDTGAPGMVTIHAPAVEQFKLLEDRPTQETISGGVGGMVKARKGTLKYFELGGNRTENVTATFATQKAGAFNSTETLGNIGHDLIKPYKIVFDYQNKRIAFLKRPSSNP